MFGKLTLEQRKALQAILIEAGVIATYQQRVNFLGNAGLGGLTKSLPMQEDEIIFAGALVRESERLGSPSTLGEYATVLLAKAVRDSGSGQTEAVKPLTEIIAVYVPDHETKYPFSEVPQSGNALVSSQLKLPINVAAFFASPINAATLANLAIEEKKVRDFLNRQTDFMLTTVTGTRLRDLLALLDRQTNRISIFHYSGHASEQGIWLEPEAGNDPEIIPWEGLAIELSHQPDLACIFLNGCESARDEFLSAFGSRRPVVIAMSEPIGDQKATLFSLRFYESLAARDDIKTAFGKACNYLRLKGYRDAAGIPRLL